MSFSSLVELLNHKMKTIFLILGLLALSIAKPMGSSRKESFHSISRDNLKSNMNLQRIHEISLQRKRRSLVKVPAVYETVKEQVLVKEAPSRLFIEPATYETVGEQIPIKPVRS